MKKIAGAVSVLLCIAVLLTGCSGSVTPETINNFVSNISDSVADVAPLKEGYNGKANYYYSTLDEKGKTEYTKIYNGYMNLKDFTVNLSRDELDYMFNCVLYDNPGIFWVGSSYSFSKSPMGIFVEPDYRCTAEEITVKSNELKSAVDKITAQSGTDSSDYGKEKFFHDYICKNTVYDLSTYDKFGDTAYSVLIDGKAICEGYARAFKMLLDSVGIYSYLVVGKTENDDGKTEGHMWNVVSVDGELYHVDLTWDDCDGELGEMTYLYFNMTDADIRMADFCAAGINDDLILEMRFSDDNAYKTVKTKALNNETDRAFFDFTVDVARLSGKRITSKSYVYDDNFNYLCIVFEKG